MDTKFQTSFIPKKPLFIDQKTIRHGGGTSVFMLIAVLVFMVSLIGAGFVFGYKQIILKNQEEYRLILKKTEEKFDVGLINKLKNINRKIDLGKDLLKSHLAVSQIFDTINQLTIESMKFNTFDFTTTQTDSKITLKGVGKNFSSIAWQSDVFGGSDKYGNKKPLKNTIVSDLVAESGGNVNFTLTASIDPKELSYEQKIVSELEQDNASNQ
jgi:hypothetical protein